MTELDTEEFLRGQRDCKEGKMSALGASSDYCRGYSAQYEAEQMMTAMGLMQDKRMGISR